MLDLIRRKITSSEAKGKERKDSGQEQRDMVRERGIVYGR
jgi:hypothetical protein